MEDVLLIKDRNEIERRRDEFARLDRINGVEKAIAVLQTKFEALLEDLRKNAVADEDLLRLKEKMEAYVQEAFGNLREYVAGENSTQSTNILGRVETMFSTMRSEQQAERIATQAALLEAINSRRSRWLWWVLGIIGGLFVAIGSTLFGVWIALSFAVPN